jgi:hypothetical protein
VLLLLLLRFQRTGWLESTGSFHMTTRPISTDSND